MPRQVHLTFSIQVQPVTPALRTLVITPSVPSGVLSKYAWSTHETTPLGMSEGQVQAATGLLPSHRLPAHPERTSAASEAAHSVAQASTCLLIGVRVHAAVRLCYLQCLVEPTLQPGTGRQWLGWHEHPSLV